jgi:hypothetical protein
MRRKKVAHYFLLLLPPRGTPTFSHGVNCPFEVGDGMKNPRRKLGTVYCWPCTLLDNQAPLADEPHDSAKSVRITIQSARHQLAIAKSAGSVCTAGCTMRYLLRLLRCIWQPEVPHYFGP